MARIDIWDHFREEMREDHITLEEVIDTWQDPDIDRPSREHPDRRVRERRMPDGSVVAVVGSQTAESLTLVTTWRR
jgi:hypothetical protein